ncbi:MAG: ABC transporter permease [Gemmatimonadaceae bacterium]|jgi:simple sugar transport system permease protein|nr:ABC transporter permease [Gemmatimonadaceae bacterium]
MTAREWGGRLALVLATGATAALLLLGIVAVAGYDAPRALAALAGGAFGSVDAVLSGTLVRATPLVLAGLAVTLAFRAGVLTIGAEGQLLAGAAAAAAAGLHTPGPWPIPLIAALVAGVVGGATTAGLAAWLRARFGVLDVISTLMLNSVVQFIVAWLVRGPLQEPLRIYPQSASLDAAARLPVLVPGTRLHLGWLLAVGLAVAGTWWLARTAAGFRVRAAGMNPHAAATAGEVDTTRVTTWAFVGSGMLAGLAGSIEVTGVTYALYENLSPGYGFTAIAVALLAGLEPALVIVTGLVFGALEAGASAMQRDAGVPSVLVAVVEALLILLLVLAERGRAAGWFTRRAARPEGNPR